MTTYAYNPAGNLSANIINNELLAIPADLSNYKVIYPSGMPFFCDGNTLTVIKPDNSTQVLTLGIDYYPAYEFASASMLTGQKVSLGYAIINPALVGSIRIASYKAFGSNWSPTAIGVASNLLSNFPTTNPMVDTYESKFIVGGLTLPVFDPYSNDQTNVSISTIADVNSSLTTIANKLINANIGRTIVNAISPVTPYALGLDQVSNTPTASTSEHMLGVGNKLATSEGIRALNESLNPSKNIVLPTVGENEVGYMFYTFGTKSAPDYLLCDGSTKVAADYPELSSTIGLDKIYSYPSVANLPIVMYYHQATTLNDGRVYICGGYNNSYLNTAYIYNPTTNTYTTVANLPIAMSYHQATTLPDGRVYICGGYTGITPANAYIYNPTTDAYTTVANLPSVMAYHQATTLPDGRVYICGGYTSSSSGLNTAYIYNPTTDAYTTVANLPVSIYYHSISTLNDGRVFICGGYTSSSSGLNTAYIYNPTTNTYTSVANLPSVMYYHQATTLPDGGVFICGGYGGTTIANVYIYNPTTNTYTSVANLPSVMYYHQATTLPDSRVFICGGSNGSALANAYITSLINGTTFTVPLLPVITKLNAYIKAKP